MELKNLLLSDCQLKFAQDKPGRFAGYGSVFGVKDSQADIVMPGAYVDVIKSGDPVQVYVNHGWLRGDLPVGKWENLQEDTIGLKGDAGLQMEMPAALNGYWALRGGLVDGLSVGIYTRPNDVERRQDGTRLIHRVHRLKEISIVDTPSNAQARVLDVKGADLLEAIEEVATLQEVEQLLRDAAGLSKRAATALVARVKSVALLGDPAAPEDPMKQLVERINRLAP